MSHIYRSHENHIQDLIPQVTEAPEANNRNNLSDNHITTESSDGSEKSIPIVSRTPSSIFPASPIHHDIAIDNFDKLHDVDGLPVIHCDVQMRIQQIIVEQKVIIIFGSSLRNHCFR